MSEVINGRFFYTMTVDLTLSTHGMDYCATNSWFWYVVACYQYAN
jgi:hypothetical protein